MIDYSKLPKSTPTVGYGGGFGSVGGWGRGFGETIHFRALIVDFLVKPRVDVRARPRTDVRANVSPPRVEIVNTKPRARQ